MGDEPVDFVAVDATGCAEFSGWFPRGGFLVELLLRSIGKTELVNGRVSSAGISRRVGFKWIEYQEFQGNIVKINIQYSASQNNEG